MSKRRALNISACFCTSFDNRRPGTGSTACLSNDDEDPECSTSGNSVHVEEGVDAMIDEDSDR